MWKEHETRSRNRGLWIEDCGLSQSMAKESCNMTIRRQTVLKVKVVVVEVLSVWHARLECYSGWM